MKKLFVLFLFSFSLSGVFSQASLLRDITCVVTSGYQDSMSTGSGFVVTTIDGVNLIISNHHVVENSYNVRIIFYPNEGPARIFDSVRVAGRLPENDMAVLSFNGDQKVFSQGIKLSLENPDDGTQVCAAGYPSGSWSYTEGMVSNRQAILRLNTSNHERQPYIQHSAVIDHGNSGGPLLVKNPEIPYGYSVVGINTFKSNNFGTYYSIPITRIIGLLDTVWKQFHEYNASDTNNTKETAVQHIFDAPIYASIRSANESLWFCFPEKTSNELTAELEATEDVLLEAYDEQGTLIGSGSGKTIRYSIKGGMGNIYLKISSPDIKFWSTYRLSVYSMLN